MKEKQFKCIAFLKVSLSPWTNLHKNLFLKVEQAYLISKMIYKLISVLDQFLAKLTL